MHRKIWTCRKKHSFYAEPVEVEQGIITCPECLEIVGGHNAEVLTGGHNNPKGVRHDAHTIRQINKRKSYMNAHKEKETGEKGTCSNCLCEFNKTTRRRMLCKFCFVGIIKPGAISSGKSTRLRAMREHVDMDNYEPGIPAGVDNSLVRRY